MRTLEKVSRWWDSVGGRALILIAALGGMALLLVAPYHQPTSPQPQTSEDKPVVAFQELSFHPEDPQVALVNLGEEPVELRGWFLCNRPSYFRLPDLTLLPGQRVVVHLGTSGTDTATEIFTGSRLPQPSLRADELALYRDSRFSSADSIVDFVQWGRAGQSPSRERVAIEAGIWPAGSFLELEDLGPDQSLYYDGTGNSPSDYFSGPSSLALGVSDAVVLIHSLSERSLSPGTIWLAAGEEARWLNLAKDGTHDPVQLVDAAGNVVFGVSFAVEPGTLSEVRFTPSAGTYTLTHRAHGHPIEGTVVVH